MNKNQLWGYVRERKSGRSREEQIALLRKAGISNFKEAGPVFFDKQKYETKPVKEGDLVWRAELLDAISSGHTVVVADYATLGISPTDWLAVLSQILSKGASLHICEPEKTFSWDDGATEIAIELANAAADVGAAISSERTAKARGARKESGRHGGAKPVDDRILEAAKKYWLDPAYDTWSAETIAHEVSQLGFGEVSRSTLIRRLPPRPKAAQQRVP